MAQPITPTKVIPMATIITQNKPQMEKMSADNLTCPMVLDPLQTSKNNHSNTTPTINSPHNDAKPSLGKNKSSCIDPFAVHVDVNSLPGCNKQKCLKSTISFSAQSYLPASTDQTKRDKDYQSARK